MEEEKMVLTEKEATKFIQCLNNGITFNGGEIWVMEFYDKNGEKYQSQEIQNIKIKIFKDVKRMIKSTGCVSKNTLSENLIVECFNKNGFLKFAEKDGKDIPLPRKDITKEEWEKLKLNL